MKFFLKFDLKSIGKNLLALFDLIFKAIFNGNLTNFSIICFYGNFFFMAGFMSSKVLIFMAFAVIVIQGISGILGNFEQNFSNLTLLLDKFSGYLYFVID